MNIFSCATASPFFKWWVAVTIMMGMLTYTLNITTVDLAVPKMMASLRADLDTIQWVVTAYMIVQTLLMPMVGWLSSLFGNRNLYLLCIGFFTFSSFLCSVAWSVQSLVIFRIIQGIGGGPLQPLSIAILYETFPPEQRGTALGMFNLATAFGLAVGRVVGGYFIEMESWRATFYLSVPFGLLSLCMAFLVIPDLLDTSKRPVDFWGLVTMGTFLVTILLAFTEGRREGWESGYILTLFTLAAVAFGIFLLVEFWLPVPLVDLRLYRYRNFTVGCLVNFLNTMVFQGLTFLIALFLQQVLPYNPWQVGLMMLPNSIAFGVFSLLSGRLSDRIDPRWAMIFGFTTFALGYYWCASLDTWTTTGTIILLLLIRSSSYGWTSSPNTYATMQGLPAEQVRMASGLYSLVRGISGTFGVALCATFLAKRRDIHLLSLIQEQDARTSDFQETASSLQWTLREAGEVGEMLQIKTTVALRSLAMREATIKAYHDLFLIGAALSVLTILPVFFFQPPGEKNGNDKE